MEIQNYSELPEENLLEILKKYYFLCNYLT